MCASLPLLASTAQLRTGRVCSGARRSLTRADLMISTHNMSLSRPDRSCLPSRNLRRCAPADRCLALPLDSRNTGDPARLAASIESILLGVDQVSAEAYECL